MRHTIDVDVSQQGERGVFRMSYYENDRTGPEALLI
jgi:hypothetical protein